jgi:hypothetical protein
MKRDSRSHPSIDLNQSGEKNNKQQLRSWDRLGCSHMSLSMICRLIQSAFQTGHLSVESEGLIRQVIAVRGYQTSDLAALEELHQAIHAGRVKREAGESVSLFSMPLRKMPS